MNRHNLFTMAAAITVAMASACASMEDGTRPNGGGGKADVASSKNDDPVGNYVGTSSLALAKGDDLSEDFLSALAPIVDAGVCPGVAMVRALYRRDQAPSYVDPFTGAPDANACPTSNDPVAARLAALVDADMRGDSSSLGKADRILHAALAMSLKLAETTELSLSSDAKFARASDGGLLLSRTLREISRGQGSNRTIVSGAEVTIGGSGELLPETALAETKLAGALGFSFGKPDPIEIPRSIDLATTLAIFADVDESVFALACDSPGWSSERTACERILETWTLELADSVRSNLSLIPVGSAEGKISAEGATLELGWKLPRGKTVIIERWAGALGSRGTPGQD